MNGSESSSAFYSHSTAVRPGRVGGMPLLLAEETNFILKERSNEFEHERSNLRASFTS